MSALSVPKALTENLNVSSKASSSTWISVAEAAALLKVQPATVIRRVVRGTIKGKISDELPFTYDGKQNYLIQLECLPQKLQYRYIANHLPEGELCTIDLASSRSKLGNLWVEQFINIADILREAVSIRAAYHSSKEVTQRLTLLAKEHGISLATLYRFLGQRTAKEASILYVDPIYRLNRVPFTMCLWSCDLALALYLDSDHYYSQNDIFNELLNRRDNVKCTTCPYHPSAKPISTVWKPSLCPAPSEFMRVPNCRKTVNRFLSCVPDQLQLYARKGYRDWRAEYGYFATRDCPLLTNEIFIGDHHKCDLFVRITIRKVSHGAIFEQEIAVRPTLTAWMDAATGCVVGWVISVMPNSDTIAEAFCRAVVITPGEPFHGLPHSIYVDYGKDYKSQLLEDSPEGTASLPADTALNRRFGGLGLLHALGVEIVHAIPYHPQSKTIERLFGTIERGWISKLDGWCRSSVAERPYNFQQKLSELLKSKKLMTLEEFSRYFAEVILPEYHGQIDNSSLPEIPGWELSNASLSPIQLYEKLPRYNTVTPDWQTICIMKMHLSTGRKIGRWGIRFRNTFYHADELSAFVGNSVDVLYHDVQPPFAPSSLTVIHHGKFLCEAFPSERFQMVGQNVLDLTLHSDVQNRPAYEYKRALSHIRISAHAILPDKANKAISENTQLYDSTYGPATIEEAKPSVECESAEQISEVSYITSEKVDINRALDFLFGEE